MEKYNILVVGGGGREHAIITKLSQSPKAGKLYAAPGNGGIATLAECLPYGATDVENIVNWSVENKIDIVFVAPDDPLMLGMVDALNEKGIRAFGPKKCAAIIEGSKAFSKDLMKKYGIPTAGYEIFSSPDEAMEYIKTQNKFPVVVKADGLALGKGVIIAEDISAAQAAIDEIMRNKIFGDSGNRVVIEEFLTGPEVSVLAFTDGKTVKPMVSAQDHKRAFDGDMGPNTGGMGTFSPSRIYTDDIADICMKTIFLPTIKAMSKEGRAFKGVIYFGLMITKDGPKVIEYNARFGDPETQVVLPRLKTDLIDIINAVIDEKLDEIDIEWDSRAAVCVVAASGGYPGKYPKGYVISGLDGHEDNITVFHAGTKKEGDTIITSGGRVLGVTAVSDTLDKAIADSYKAIAKISFTDMFYRKDIGIK